MGDALGGIGKNVLGVLAIFGTQGKGPLKFLQGLMGDKEEGDATPEVVTTGGQQQAPQIPQPSSLAPPGGPPPGGMPSSGPPPMSGQGMGGQLPPEMMQMIMEMFRRQGQQGPMGGMGGGFGR